MQQLQRCCCPTSQHSMLSHQRSKRLFYPSSTINTITKKPTCLTWYDNLPMTLDGDCRKYAKQLVKHSRRPAICWREPPAVHRLDTNRVSEIAATYQVRPFCKLSRAKLSETRLLHWWLGGISTKQVTIQGIGWIQVSVLSNARMIFVIINPFKLLLASTRTIH